MNIARSLSRPRSQASSAPLRQEHPGTRGGPKGMPVPKGMKGEPKGMKGEYSDVGTRADDDEDHGEDEDEGVDLTQHEVHIQSLPGSYSSVAHVFDDQFSRELAGRSLRTPQAQTRRECGSEHKRAYFTRTRRLPPSGAPQTRSALALLPKP